MRDRTGIAAALVFAALFGGAGPFCALACAAESPHPQAALANAAPHGDAAAPCPGHAPRPASQRRGGHDGEPGDAGCNHALASAHEADALLADACALPSAGTCPAPEAPTRARVTLMRTGVPDPAPPDLVLLHSSLRL
jgi:hypothetical protein